MAEKEQKVEVPTDPNHDSFKDLRYGIGQMLDGTIDTFPLDELEVRTEMRDREERAFQEAMKEKNDQPR